MSRYLGENDGYDDMRGDPAALYDYNWTRHIQSANGQRLVRELEAALVALPQPRLIVGALCREGEVCAIGAYVVKKRVERGERREDVIRHLGEHSAKHDADYDSYEAATDTVDVAKRYGLSSMLAWAISQFNDELEGATPEEVHARVLRYVRSLTIEWHA